MRLAATWLLCQIRRLQVAVRVKKRRRAAFMRGLQSAWKVLLYRLAAFGLSVMEYASRPRFALSGHPVWCGQGGRNSVESNHMLESLAGERKIGAMCVCIQDERSKRKVPARLPLAFTHPRGLPMRTESLNQGILLHGGIMDSFMLTEDAILVICFPTPPKVREEVTVTSNCL